MIVDNNKVVLYLMRHGQTIINKAKRVQGWCDGVLTKEGEEVVTSTALGLRDIKFKAVYSSDLGRAVKTAKIVIRENKANKDLELVEVPGLREMHFGKYEGEIEKVLFNDIFKKLNIKSFEEALKIPDFGRAFADTCASLDETGQAENYDIMINRVMGALTEITKEASNNGGGNILLVVHGGILRNIFNQLDKSIDVSGIENASISKVEYENGEYKVITTNDMSYKIKGEKIREEEFSN